MIEFSRKELKEDEVLSKLFEGVKNSHTVARYTQKVLYNNRHIKDFCEEARHFAVLPAKEPMYIHYDVSSWWKEPNGAQIKIERIGVYDNFLEYEVARLKGLHSTKNSDIPNIN